MLNRCHCCQGSSTGSGAFTAQWEEKHFLGAVLPWVTRSSSHSAAPRTDFRRTSLMMEREEEQGRWLQLCVCACVRARTCTLHSLLGPTCTTTAARVLDFNLPVSHFLHFYIPNCITSGLCANKCAKWVWFQNEISGKLNTDSRSPCGPDDGPDRQIITLKYAHITAEVIYLGMFLATLEPRFAFLSPSQTSFFLSFEGHVLGGISSYLMWTFHSQVRLLKTQGRWEKLTDPLPLDGYAAVALPAEWLKQEQGRINHWKQVQLPQRNQYLNYFNLWEIIVDKPGAY